MLTALRAHVPWAQCFQEVPAKKEGFAMQKFPSLRGGACFPAQSCVVIAALFLFPAVATADNLNVHCGNPSPPPGTFSSITAALTSLSVNMTSEPHTITVTGTCTENISLANRQRITLQAPGGQTATIVNAASPASDVVRITRSRSITLRGLVIQGGSRGVVIDDSSEVDMDLCTIENSSVGAGLRVSDLSNLRLTQVTIRNNRGTGLAVDDSSFVVAGEGSGNPFLLVQNNGLHGISVSEGTLMIYGFTTIENNAGVGIYTLGSRANLFGLTSENIIRNNGLGLTVNVASSIRFFGKNTIQNNGSVGVQVMTNTSVAFDEATMPDNSIGVTTIEGHTGCGLSVSGSSDLYLMGRHKIRNNGSGSPASAGIDVARATASLGYGVEVSNSNGYGIRAGHGAQIQLRSSDVLPVVIANNAKEGLRLTNLASVRTGASSAIQGNGVANISCDDSAWLFGDLTGITGIVCKNALEDEKKKK
jgi:hypothetical protein